MPRPDLSGTSRDAALTLSRVEREHEILRVLARSPERTTAAQLAARTGVAVRTIERDVDRLRQAGLPLQTTRGPGGGIRLDVPPGRRTLHLEVDEIAALLASMVALGPTATDLAASATRALVEALRAGTSS